jgi:hypothetical protein
MARDPLLVALLSAALAASPAAAQELDWLSGCWVGEDGSREVWSRSEGGLLFGYAVQLGADGQADFFEQLRIEAEGDALAYVASPNGAPPTRFDAALVGPDRALFANPEHDFPQVLDYVRDGSTLTATAARLDGTDAVVFRKSRCRARP